jgi:hypothetical protein
MHVVAEPIGEATLFRADYAYKAAAVARRWRAVMALAQAA